MVVVGVFKSQRAAKVGVGLSELGRCVSSDTGRCPTSAFQMGWQSWNESMALVSKNRLQVEGDGTGVKIQLEEGRQAKLTQVTAEREACPWTV